MLLLLREHLTSFLMELLLGGGEVPLKSCNKQFSLPNPVSTGEGRLEQCCVGHTQTM